MRPAVRLAVVGLIALAAGIIAGRPARSASQQLFPEALPMDRSIRTLLGSFIEASRGARITSPPANFDFSYFESLPEADIVPAAKKYLEQKYPPGTDVKAALRELEAAGAKCGPDPLGKPDIMGCGKYTRTPLSYGPIALFSSMSWQIWFYLAPGTDRIRSIFVARHLDTI